MSGSKLEKLGIFKVEATEYHAFYNGDEVRIDYFILNKKDKTVDCLSIKFEVIKNINIFEDFNIATFKNEYRDILSKLVVLEDEVYEKIIMMQVFPIDLWDEGVLKDFKDMEFEAL